MKLIFQSLVYLLWGFFALVVILALFALGRTLRTGLEESEWDDDDDSL